MEFYLVFSKVSLLCLLHYPICHNCIGDDRTLNCFKISATGSVLTCCFLCRVRCKDLEVIIRPHVIARPIDTGLSYIQCHLHRKQ